MSKSRCRYQDQNADMTLREGIKEYYETNPHLLFPDGSSKDEQEAAQFFKCHDRIHVVFGCDTSFLHEVRADFWTFLGSDLGILKYAAAIMSPAIKMLMKDLKANTLEDPSLRSKMLAEVKQSIFLAMGVPAKVFFRTRRMKKKWPWTGSETLMDVPLRKIREEFNIRLLD